MPAGQLQYESILLDPVETQLKSLLLDVASQIASSNSGYEQPILRFTGGWVRDKLLQQSSHDIDVSISNMTGAQFSERLQQFLNTNSENAQKYGDVSFHTIAANPEKSKHLETVTTRILGLEIDFVNLRKETYTEDSRNPQMEFGTPEEDALRRDATVNALFYNINTDKVEDFTKRGLEDMQAKIIRTPLEPRQTFMDDPLRVLRLIRFASRLDFKLDEAVEQAMKDAAIKDALRRKISRERVEIELSKMFRGRDPHLAISLIHKAGLYETIFCDPDHPAEADMAPHSDELLSIADNLQTILKDKQSSLSSSLLRSKEDEYQCWILACLVPYRDAFLTKKKGDLKKLPDPKATDVVRDGLKSTRQICNLVTAAVRNRERISKKVSISYSADVKRDDLGMSIRSWGSTWRLQTMFALLASMADGPDLAEDVEERFSHFIKQVDKLDLLNVCDTKTIIDGKQLASALGIKPGPWMKDALEVVIAWQLRNPQSTDPSEVIEQIRTSRSDGELAKDLAQHFLRLTIRPLFAKNPHPSITPHGRKVTARVIPGRPDPGATAEERTPWKAESSLVMGLLEWIVTTGSSTTIESNWNLIVPPILSILDDAEEDYKTQGCELLELLLKGTSRSLLERTGLTDVFRDTLMPCLLYIPSLTPADKSAPLLINAFGALFSLNDTAFPSGNDDTRQKRIALLDRILREGIFTAYSHCSSVPKITIVLVENLEKCIQELGIESVRHIKHILPMLAEVLNDQYAAVNPGVSLAATRALQTLILNAWPRMVVNRGEVLRALCSGWQRISEDEFSAKGADEVKIQLKKTLMMLEDAVGTKCDLETECRSLVEADGSLAELFKDLKP